MDTQGLLVKTRVHPADIHDKEGAKLLLSSLAGKLPRMAKVWVDSAYRGLKQWAQSTLGWEIEVVREWNNPCMGAGRSGASCSGHLGFRSCPGDGW